MDQIVRTIAKDAPVKAMAFTARGLVERARQIPTACALGVLVTPDQSVQYFIQLLPGAGDGAIAPIEQGVQRAGAVTAALDGGASALDLLRQVLSEFELEVLETSAVECRCYCDRERVSRAPIGLGREELTSLIREQQGAELTCRSCDRVYRFDAGELEELLRSATK